MSSGDRAEISRDGAWDGYAGAVTDDLFGASPAAAKFFLRALDRLVKLDNIRLPPELVHARRGLMRVSGVGIYGHGPQAGSGHADTTDEAFAAGSEDWITTAQAARELGLTQRQCARLAEAREEYGLARKVKGRWWIQQDEVDALAERKTA